MRGCLPVLAFVLIFSACAIRAEKGDEKPIGIKIENIESCPLILTRAAIGARLQLLDFMHGEPQWK